jgi:cytochrome bd-type quinol oxidase subunit 2
MFGLFSFLIAAGVLASIPAWRAARNTNKWRWWDFASLIVPYLVWITLAFLGFGAQSLGNLEELLVLVVVVPLALSLRVFLFDRRTKARATDSVVVFALLCIVAICLRAFFPMIPE